MTNHFGIEYGGAALSVDPIYWKLWLEAKASVICEIAEKI